jgi:hypothetical protein
MLSTFASNSVASPSREISIFIPPIACPCLYITAIDVKASDHLVKDQKSIASIAADWYPDYQSNTFNGLIKLYQIGCKNYQKPSLVLISFENISQHPR